jgi:glycosyltransferase involved in cell wall biosynthesis
MYNRGASAGNLPAAKRVAIIYPYLAHYREAVFQLLSDAGSRHSYVIFSDRRSNLPSIATISPEKSKSTGGTLNWRFIRNWWVTPRILWQSAALHIAAGREFDTLIFLGDAQFLSTWLAAIIGRLRGKRILMWTHGILRQESGLRAAIRGSFYRLAHGLLLYGHRARRLLMAQGFDAARLYVIYNSLDTERQLRALDAINPSSASAVRNRFGIPTDAPLLICIGRLVEGKELHLLPQAVAKLKANGTEVHLLFIGGGQIRSRLEAMSADLAIQGQVHFGGEIYAEEDLCPLIHAADLCVSPGSVGLMAMHALVYGTPVITHDETDAQKPEFEVIVPGVNGDLFKRGDPGELAATVAKWLSAKRRRDDIRHICQESVLDRYTPGNQRTIIENAVDALPAKEAEPLHGSRSSEVMAGRPA